MDDIIEFILELLLEGGIELGSNKKVPKWIRYPLLGLIFLFFGVIIIGIIVLGLAILKENVIAGLVMIVIGVVLLIVGIIKFRNKYLEKGIKERKEEE